MKFLLPVVSVLVLLKNVPLPIDYRKALSVDSGITMNRKPVIYIVTALGILAKMYQMKLIFQTTA